MHLLKIIQAMIINNSKNNTVPNNTLLVKNTASKRHINNSICKIKIIVELYHHKNK